MPLVSVIIPSFNRAHTLERAVNSVLKQIFTDFECIIVDDGSTDDTAQIIQKLKSQDDRVKSVVSENQGVSAARNLGFSNSCGQWIALLDSDDEWLPTKLKAQLELAQTIPEVPLIHGEEIWIRNGKRVNQKFKHKKVGGWIFNDCLALCFISPSTALIKRSLYEEMNGFRDDFVVCEDYELWLRVTQKYEVGLIEEPVIYKYGGHDDQLSFKYKAMDYWRVKAMEEIYRNPDYALKKDEEIALVNMLLEKCRILKIGYIKHNNLEHLGYIDLLINEFSSIKESLSR